MSANQTPGLHRVERKHRPYGLATKITGRNTASVSYLISLEAERRGVELVLLTAFEPDGQLKGMGVIEHVAGVAQEVHDLPAGGYLVLDPESADTYILTEDEYRAFYDVRG